MNSHKLILNFPPKIDAGIEKRVIFGILLKERQMNKVSNNVINNIAPGHRYHERLGRSLLRGFSMFGGFNFGGYYNE